MTGDSGFAPLRIDRHVRIPLSLGLSLCRSAPALRPPRLARASTSSPEGGPELPHVVRGADQRPFSTDLPHPSQQKLAEAAPLLDLPEDRLHDRFSFRIEGSASLCSQRTPHPFGHGPRRGSAAAWRRRHGPSMVLPIRRDQGFTAQRGHGRDIGFADIARIQARDPWYVARVRHCLEEEWLRVLFVIRRIGHVRGDDDLRRRLHRGLAMIAVHETPLRAGGRHDPAFGIREVALRLGAGDRAGWVERDRRGPLVGRLGLRLQHRLGRANGLQSLLPAG